MAYRKSKGKLAKRAKIQPAVMQLQFQVPPEDSYIDLALAASIVNRRGYKQENHSWFVQQFELFGSGTGTVVVEKLPETWVFDNAYKKARLLWDEMNDQVLDTEPGIQGKWHDFKIAMDSAQHSQTIQDTLNPAGRILTPSVGAGAINFTTADFSGAVSPRADWEYSQLTIPNDGGPGVSVDYLLHAVGPDTVSSKGIITGYAKSRARPQAQDPNVPTSEGWMTDLFDVGDQLEELRDIIVEDNDRPPYALSPEQTGGERYPGGSVEFGSLQTHSFCNFTTTTVSGKNSIMGGRFQNGLMKFQNNTGENVSIIVHLVPGMHRGYMCEVMD